MKELFSRGICQLYFEGNSAAILALTFASIIVGYLLGSLNFGVIVSKLLYHGDIRNFGSGNAGTTNMLRTYGKKAAILTLAGDMLKTAIAVFIGSLLLGDHILGLYGNYLGGLAGIAGHVYPIYYKFRGGKGVASAAMMILCTDYIVFAVLLLIFVIIVHGTKFISLGSIMCMLVYPLLLNRLTGPGLHNLLAILLALFVIFLHRQNIHRLLNGSESKLSFKSKK